VRGFIGEPTAMDDLTKTVAPVDVAAIDLKMMRRCIELSKTAGKQGEFPFASLVCKGETILAESTNRVTRDKDITRHAELVTVSQAQKAIGRKKLNNCTLYSNVEPCVMCAFPLREARVSRVVFALRSPLMGGFSRWNVLADGTISDALPEGFGRPVEVIVGLLAQEAEDVWQQWNPIVWGVIKQRGCFEAGPIAHHFTPRKRHFLRDLLSIFYN
jgi:tRNA(adenine34) deaminase